MEHDFNMKNSSREDNVCEDMHGAGAAEADAKTVAFRSAPDTGAWGGQMIVCPALVHQIVVTFGSRVSRGNDVGEGE